MRVAFFSMEILLDKLPTYAGGMGILAGDFIESASDLNFPIVGITLLHNKGYVQHKIEGKNIIDLEEEFEPLEFFERRDEEVEIELKIGKIYLNIWEYKLGNNKIFLLDSNHYKNEKWIRKLTERLYIENSIEERVLKEIILGIGGYKLLKILGISPEIYHINETHPSFLIFEIIKEKGIEGLKESVVFTTHTPLGHGHEKYDYNVIEKFLDVPKEIKEISPQVYDPTRILQELSKYSNCVSWKHSIINEKLYGKRLDYITNGVYHKRWIHERIKELISKYIPGWEESPEKLAYAGIIPIEEIKNTKKVLKKEFVEYINSTAILNYDLDPEKIIFTARRRITGYKRVTMPIWDFERIESISKKYGIQFVFSGISHPKDLEGKAEIKRILDAISTLKYTKVAFVPRRGVELEKFLISGSDVWLHTSKPPLEACGTSWMRAGINLVPSLSSKDGGVIEVIIDGYNGWLFGENLLELKENYNDFEEFMEKLEEITNMYYNNYEEFLKVSRNALKTIGPLFNSYRMVKEYIMRGYR